jgi:hypothetical protein
MKPKPNEWDWPPTRKRYYARADFDIDVTPKAPAKRSIEQMATTLLWTVIKIILVIPLAALIFAAVWFLCVLLSLPGHSKPTAHVERVCMDNLKRSDDLPAHVQWWEIGECLFFSPSNASKRVFSRCHEGDMCLVRAIGTLEYGVTEQDAWEQYFRIERVISVSQPDTD